MKKTLISLFALAFALMFGMVHIASAGAKEQDELKQKKSTEIEANKVAPAGEAKADAKAEKTSKTAKKRARQAEPHREHKIGL
jgi:hypothetical protein